MKRLLLMGAAGLIAAPLVVRAALGPRYGGEVTVAVPIGAADRMVSGLVHETLLRQADDGAPIAGLAELSVQAPSEAVLTLRGGATFHDGKPVRAADAVASLQRFLRSSSAAAQALSRAVIGIETLDDRRLVLHTNGPRPVALAALAARGAVVTAPSGAGAGPFIPTVVVPERRASLRAFTDHVRGRPYLDGLMITTLTDGTDAAQALRDGRADVAFGAPGVSTPAATLVLALDRTRPPFDAAALRAAVDATVDRVGLARLLSFSALPPTLLMGPAATESPPRAGPGRDAAVVLGVEDGVPPLASQRVVATLGALGLRVTVTQRRAAETRGAADHARLLAFLPEVNEPVLTLRELRSLVPGASAADEALEAAEREPAVEARRALLAQAESALRQERACLTLIRLPVSFGARPGIHGVTLAPDGRLALEDAWLEPRP